MGVTFIAKEGTYTAPATLTTKTITENGTYSAVDDSANGYSSVTVNVEGGGGSSDFSMAKVTFRSSSGTYRVASCNIGLNNDLTIGTLADVTSNESFMAKVPLIDGKAYISAESFINVDFSEMPVFSGGIAMNGSSIVITGNGSITLKGTV